VGLEVFTATSLKMAVFWVVAPCRLVDVSMAEAAGTSETSVNFQQTTGRYNPEDSRLRVRMYYVFTSDLCYQFYRL
jgi:hypothetical protein